MVAKSIFFAVFSHTVLVQCSFIRKERRKRVIKS